MFDELIPSFHSSLNQATLTPTMSNIHLKCVEQKKLKCFISASQATDLSQ